MRPTVKNSKKSIPAEGCIEVSQLPAPVQIEIEAVAYFPKNKKHFKIPSPLLA